MEEDNWIKNHCQPENAWLYIGQTSGIDADFQRKLFIGQSNSDGIQRTPITFEGENDPVDSEYAKNYQKNMKVLMEKFKDLLIGQSDCNGREEFTDYGLRMIAFPKLTAKNWVKYLKSKKKWRS